jgi:hypothetical protein
VAKLIVEIFERNRSEIRVCHFDRLPISVGRGYDNDLIISDPFVSAEHFSISECGAGFVLEDLNSENGTSVNGRCLKDRELEVQSSGTVKIGHTRLRIFAPDHLISSTLKFDFWERFSGSRSFNFLAWASLLPTFGFAMLNEYLTTFKQVEISDLISEVMPLIIFLSFGWACFWSFIGYSARRRAMFHAQLLVGNLLMVTVSMVSIPEYLSYALNWPWLAYVGDFMLTSFLFSCFIFIGLGIATAADRKRRATVSFSITAVLVGIILLWGGAQKSDFKDRPDFAGYVKPPALKWASSQSASTFLTDSKNIFEVDEPHQEVDATVDEKTEDDSSPTL